MPTPAFSSFLPGALKVRKVSFGIASDSPDVTVGSTGLTTLFTVPLGTIVTEFYVHVRNIFSGGTATMTFGDPAAVAGYIGTASAIMSDLGLKSSRTLGSTGGAESAYARGRAYVLPADDRKIQVAIAAAAITTGLADAYLVYFSSIEA